MIEAPDTDAPNTKKKLSPQEDFIAEMTRQRLVSWCNDVVTNIGIPEFNPADPYVAFAVKKGWVSKDLKKILTPGWKTAAAFLRR